MVARQQLGMLAMSFKPWFMTQFDIENYLGAWDGDKPPRISVAVPMLCLPDGELARQLAKQALTWFYRELYEASLPLLEKLYPGYAQFHELSHFRDAKRHGLSLSMLESFAMVVVGNPRECIEQLRRFEVAGVTHIQCVVGAGAVETGIARESLRCIAKEVMPAFRQE